MLRSLYLNNLIKLLHEIMANEIELIMGRRSNTPPLVFSKFFKLHKWYQIAQRISYIHKRAIKE